MDFKVTLKDGGFHAVDSSSIAFEIAAKAAYRQTMPKGAPQFARADHENRSDDAGRLYGSGDRRFLARRGQVLGQDMRGNAVVINAMVPLANMFGYVNQLRSFSQGRANYTMQFDHYEHVPAGEGG